jgi:uncharacterized membrane protein
VTRIPASIVGFLIVLAALVLSVWAYPLLPASVPTHWNMAGQVNGYSSRLFAVSFTPALMGIMWLLMLVLPAISPRGFSLGESAGGFYIAMLAVLALMLAVHWMVLRAALTHVGPSVTLFLVLLGALFIVLGILVARAKKNFWFGVRTPWTLANHEVWARTNQFGGRLLVIGGVMTALVGFFAKARMPVLVAIIVIIAAAPIVYSYVTYRRIEGFDSES